VRYCSDRKEAKDHGADVGQLLGTTLHDGDRVVIVEDVTTSGKSIDETYPKLMAAAQVEVVGLMVSLNREEVGKGGVHTAQQEIQEKYGFPVASIVGMHEVVEALEGSVITPELKEAIDAYYAQYGVQA
jgi:orotate phosphoribosyltransferase